jgi:hypothetical protein
VGGYRADEAERSGGDDDEDSRNLRLPLNSARLVNSVPLVARVLLGDFLVATLIVPRDARHELLRLVRCIGQKLLGGGSSQRDGPASMMADHDVAAN